MKRFHTHVAVEDISASTAFYSNLFGQEPSVQRPDYAKWMLDDPRVNFAISARGHATGVNHFGFEAENEEELEQLKARAEAASPDYVISQEGATCCYAKSDKHWTVDPQGLAWENFLTMSAAAEFGDDTAIKTGACCIPVRKGENDSEVASGACCIPQENAAAGACCDS